ncbi:hypothetical protein AMK23_05530 [Streptomyces sp. CB02130]|nr:hypothetical protein AMK23_05530 [Streptomyces sp. CB02130]
MTAPKSSSRSVSAYRASSNAVPVTGGGPAAARRFAVSAIRAPVPSASSSSAPSAHIHSRGDVRCAISGVTKLCQVSSVCTNSSTGQSRYRRLSRYGAGGPSSRTTTSRSDRAVRRLVRTLPPRNAAQASG